MPGFFAADGAAGETSAEAGGQLARPASSPTPKASGPSTPSSSAARTPPSAAMTRCRSRRWSASPTARSASDRPTSEPPTLAGRACLRDVGERYFVFAGTNEPFLKGGADSPENLLAFADFDATTPTHRYEPHARDWRPGRSRLEGGPGQEPDRRPQLPGG